MILFKVIKTTILDFCLNTFFNKINSIFINNRFDKYPKRNYNIGDTVSIYLKIHPDHCIIGDILKINNNSFLIIHDNGETEPFNLVILFSNILSIKKI